MAWVQLTERDLLTAISGAELQAFRKAVLDRRQPDPVPDVLAQAVSLVRGYVAGCSNNVLSRDNTLIPEELISVALDLAVVDVMKRVAGIVIDMDGERKKSSDNAISILRDVAACKFAVSKAEDADADQMQNGVASPLFSGRERPLSLDG